jgi:hypothetical protein
MQGKRVFFTKRDFELKSAIQGLVTYNGFISLIKMRPFLVTDSTYFCNKSWTATYDPLLQELYIFP